MLHDRCQYRSQHPKPTCRLPCNVTTKTPQHRSCPSSPLVVPSNDGERAIPLVDAMPLCSNIATRSPSPVDPIALHSIPRPCFTPTKPNPSNGFYISLQPPPPSICFAYVYGYLHIAHNPFAMDTDPLDWITPHRERRT